MNTSFGINVGKLYAGQNKGASLFKLISYKKSLHFTGCNNERGI
jgi:hypothetical protein